MTDPRPVDALRHSKSHVVVDDTAHPVLSDDETHHLAKVLRLVDGDPISCTDGRGHFRLGVWSGGGFDPTGEVGFLPRPTNIVTIGVAIPKQDRPEWIIQKCAELGVARVVLLHAERSVVRWSDGRADKKVDKLRRTAQEALRQSRGVWLTTVDGPVSAAQMLPDAMIAEPGAAPLDLARARCRTFLIGPEGGWDPSEVMRAAGTFGLGDTVLRVETAALVTAARAAGTQSESSRSTIDRSV